MKKKDIKIPISKGNNHTASNHEYNFNAKYPQMYMYLP